VSLALSCLVGLTLLLSGVVAAVPSIVIERTPRPRPLHPDSGVSERLRIVEGPGDRWFVNGTAVSRSALTARLARGDALREVRYLPSAALTMAGVTESLTWLRQRNSGPVMLELLPPAR
jgi:hypothetical protein